MRMFSLLGKVFAPLLLFMVLMVSPVAWAAEVPKEVLWVPWGASPEQARQKMIEQKNVFVREMRHPIEGHFEQQYDGEFVAFPAKFYLRFLDLQMFQLDAVIWTDDSARQTHVFNEFSAALMKRYGPFSRDESRLLPVKPPSRPAYNVPITIYAWYLYGGALKISLKKQPSFVYGADPRKDKFDGSVSVSYENLRLLADIKNKVRQKI